MKISLILPAYNEVRGLENAVKKVEAVLKRMKKIDRYEIIIAEDGSTDGTDEVAQRLASKSKAIRHLHSSKRLGKGKALKNAFSKAAGDILIFSDVDLSTNIELLPKLVQEIKNGADVCIGSRLLKSSKTERSALREIASNAYNKLVKLLFKTKITDFQCGFKAFEKRTLPILLSSKNNKFFWDTEALLRCKRAGMQVKEIPVEWKECKSSKVKLFCDVLSMGTDMISLRLKFFFQPKLNHLQIR